MKREYSADYPEIRRHRNKIIVPLGIIETGSSEGRPQYQFLRCELPDNGQDLSQEAVKVSLQSTAQDMLSEENFQAALGDGCYIASLGFRIDCTLKARDDFTETLNAYALMYPDEPNREVIVKDFDNEIQHITYAEYQVMYQELCAHLMALRLEKWGINS